MTGSVYQRGPKRYHKVRVRQRDPSTGRYPWITNGGYDIERDACLRDSCLGNSLLASYRLLVISDSPHPIKGNVIPESIRRVKGRCGQDDGLIEIALVGHAHRYQVRIERGSGAPHSYEAPGSVLVPAVKREQGRPAKPIEFYRRVADAARDAEADPDRRGIARGVQARAAQWPDIDGTPPLTTVERWLKQARKHGLYRRPRDKHRTPTRAAAHVQPMKSRLSQTQSRTTTRRPQP